jgi:hypothetical protein
MGALEDYVRSQRRTKDRNDPMRDSVMSRPSETWQSDYERKGGHALEQPMVSPDDLIGTGVPSKVVGVLSKLAGTKALGGGALGVLVGMRGAERIGSNMILDALSKEHEFASQAKRAGQEYRNQHNSGDLRVHTGFDGKPWFEVGDADLLPRKGNTQWGKPVPLLDQWRIPDKFFKAYEPELAATRLENSLTEPLGTGFYARSANEMGLGYGVGHLKPEHQEFFRQYPMAADQRVRSAMAHELTHLGQGAEGAIGGTTPEYMRDILHDKNIDSQFEKYLMKAGVYRDLSEGKDPLELLRTYGELGMSKDNWRGIQRIIQNAHKEDPVDMMELSQINTDFANRIMRSMEKRDTLQGLLDKGISYAAPYEVKTSAKGFGQDNPMKGLSQEQVADLYTLYRANAGEAQADQVAERLTLPLQHASDASKRTTPFFEDFPFPPEFLHSVR